MNKAVEAARAADLVLLVVGYTHPDEGEFVNATPLVAKEKGGDRGSLTLSPADEALILQASRANPRCVVVMEGGSAIITEAWRECVPAILMLWYPGMEGGTALANLLAGDANPSGKLPCVFPRSPKQLPFFDADAREIEYDLYHGYRLMDNKSTHPPSPSGMDCRTQHSPWTSCRSGRQRLARKKSCMPVSTCTTRVTTTVRRWCSCTPVPRVQPSTAR